MSTELFNDKRELGSKGQYQNLNIMELLTFCTEVMILVKTQSQNLFSLYV